MGIYIIKSIHSDWIKIGHHRITKRRPSVYYRFINRGFYSVKCPEEIRDRVGGDDLKLIYWFENLDTIVERQIHKKLRLLFEYEGEWYRNENISMILNIIINDFNGVLKLPDPNEIFGHKETQDY